VAAGVRVLGAQVDSPGSTILRPKWLALNVGLVAQFLARREKSDATVFERASRFCPEFVRDETGGASSRSIVFSDTLICRANFERSAELFARNRLQQISMLDHLDMEFRDVAIPWSSVDRCIHAFDRLNFHNRPHH
jgi:hypothetical protein